MSHDPLIVHAANRGEVLVEDSYGNTVPGWLLNVRGNKVRVCFCNGQSGTVPRTRIRVPARADALEWGQRTGPAGALATPRAPAPSARPLEAPPMSVDRTWSAPPTRNQAL